MIVEEANINRKTFYDYFACKEDLLIFVENKIISEFKTIFNGKGQYTTFEVNDLLDRQIPNQINLEICKHMKHYRAFYKSRFTDMIFYQKFSNELYTLLQPYLNDSRVSQYLSYGTIGYLKKWLDNDCEYPIEEVAIGLAESGMPPILRVIEKA